jgi:pilus assembly protein CpaF
MTLDKLESYGSVSSELRMVLEGLVAAKKNILVSGGTNSGKTSLLNSLSRCIAEDERILTVEDSRELQILQPNWVALETVVAYKEGMIDVPISHLVKNTLRQTPDRIIVGECRGEEALFMLRAFSTGHSGGMSTVHANSAPDALDQIQLLAQFGASAGVSGATIAQLVARAVDIVIQVHQFEEDSSRKLTEIIEVSRPGVRFEGGAATYLYRRLLNYEVTGRTRTEEGKPRLIGHWTYPEAPSPSLMNTLRFKNIPWPEASLAKATSGVA